MNGATEQTLSELLAEARRTNSSIAALTNLMARMNTGGGGGGGGNAAAGAASAMAGLASKISPVGIALSALSAAGSLVSGVFDGLSSIVGKAAEAIGGVINGLVQFGQKAMDGTAKMSDLFTAFNRLPYFIGEVASLFASLLRTGEQYLDVYRSLTKVGADFGGNLFQMQTQASRAYLTLKEFSGIVERNSDVFSTMGGNVQSGISRFIELQNGLMKGAFKNQILGLGYSFEEAAQTTMGFMRSQGVMSKDGLANIEIVRHGVLQYAMELDSLSKMTGRQRDQIAKELESMNMEESWQNFLSQIDDPNKAASMRAAVNAMQIAGGKDARQNLQLQFQGLNAIIGEGQAALEVVTNGMMSNSTRQIAEMVESGKSAKEVAAMTVRLAASMGGEANKFRSSMGGVNAVMSQQGNILSTVAGRVIATFRNTGNALNAVTAAENAQAKQASGSAVAYALAEDKVRQVGMALNNLWNGIVSRLSPNIITLGDSILSVIKNLIGNKGFQETLTNVLTWVNNAFGSLLQSKNVDDFWSRLKTVFTDGFEKLWRWVQPVWENTIKPAAIQMFNSIVEFLTPTLRKAFNYVFDSINTYLYSKSTLLGTDPKIQAEYRKETETYLDMLDKVKSLESRIKVLQSYKDLSPTEKSELNLKQGEKRSTEEQLRKLYIALGNQRTLLPGYGFDEKTFKDDKLKDMVWEFLNNNKYWERGPTASPVSDSGQNSTVVAGEPPTDQNEANSNMQAGTDEETTAVGIQRLNSLAAQQILVMKENNRHARDTIAAIKSLSGNLFV